jgi:peroxiredoxin
LSDTGKSASVAYGAAAGTDAEKAARVSVLIGPDGKVARAYSKVTPAEHPDQVMADIKSLG